MPASSARATARSWSAGAPLVIRPPTAPQPKVSTETCSPVRPSVRFSINQLPVERRELAGCASCGPEPRGTWWAREKWETPMRLTDFKVLTFDCYGTLIDWETGMVEALKPLTEPGEGAAQPQRRSWKRMRATNPRSSCRRRRNPIASCSPSSTSASPRNGGSRRAGTTAWPMAARSATGRHFRTRRGARLSQAALQARDPLECRQRDLQPQQQEARRRRSTRSTRPKTSAPTSRAARNFDYMLDKLGDAGSPRTMILHTAESMFHDHKPGERSTGCNHAGSTAATPTRVSARPMNPGDMPRLRFPLHQHGRTRQGASGGSEGIKRHARERGHPVLGQETGFPLTRE